MAGGHRPHHDLLELGLGGRQEIEGCAVRVEQRQKRRDRLKAAIGVAAQHRDDAGEPRLDHGAQQARKGLGPLGLDLDEQPLDLIKRDHELRRPRCVIPHRLRPQIGGARERSPDWRKRRLATCCKQLREQVRCRKVAGLELCAKRAILEE